MWQKPAAILVMILSVIGLVLCLAALVGSWLLNGPATTAITSSLDALDGYLNIAAQTTAQVDARLNEAQSSVQSLAATSPERAAEAQATLQQKVVPIVTQVDATLTTLQNSVTTANKMLTQISRLPGIDAPSLGDQLDTLEQQITGVDDKLTDLTSALADKNLDGSKVTTAANALSAKFTEIQSALNTWTARIKNVRASLVPAKDAIPRRIDQITIIVTLLAFLLGAGQVSLFMHGLKWFRVLNLQPAVAMA